MWLIFLLTLIISGLVNFGILFLLKYSQGENMFFTSDDNIIRAAFVKTKHHGVLYNYLITDTGMLLSINTATWELDSKKGKDILICSNGSINKQGLVHNSLRNIRGKKITVNRCDIAADQKWFDLEVELKGHRHFTLLNKSIIKEKVA